MEKRLSAFIFATSSARSNSAAASGMLPEAWNSAASKCQVMQIEGLKAPEILKLMPQDGIRAPNGLLEIKGGGLTDCLL